MTIETPKGPIEIVPPSSALLQNLRTLLPFGLCGLGQAVDGAAYGIVMQCGDKEVWCIKQQPIEVERKAAEQWLQIHHLMVAFAMTRHLQQGFSGAYLAGPYLRQRDNGLWESGVGHFPFPSSKGMEAVEFPFDQAFDPVFGHGATVLMSRFTEAFLQAFRDMKLSPPGYIGLDVRPRLHLQSLSMTFMAVGAHLICLRAKLRESEDAAWAILAGGGVSQVIHLPAIPIGIQPENLPTTKGLSI